MSEPSKEAIGKTPQCLAPERTDNRADGGKSETILARAEVAPGGAARDDKPPQQRPELPDFWDHRFRNRTTPWDAGGVPVQLREFAASLGRAPRTLIPGCGSAHEAGHLDALGWPVTALDFSQQAIIAAREVLGDFGGELRHADFFSFSDTPFELIYERAFLCALPRHYWPAYAQRAADLLTPNGLLAGFFFLGEAAKGPPFAIRPYELEALLTPYFMCIEDLPARDPIAVFASGERWQVWQRR